MCGRIARRVSAENKRVRRGRHLKYWPEAHADAAHVMSDDPAPALITALQEPADYPHAVESVRLVETHISWVLLAGDYAYKIKKPVDFGFLDFSSLAQRRHYCEEELRLNRRFAPQFAAREHLADVHRRAVTRVGRGHRGTAENVWQPMSQYFAQIRPRLRSRAALELLDRVQRWS